MESANADYASFIRQNVRDNLRHHIDGVVRSNKLDVFEDAKESTEPTFQGLPAISIPESKYRALSLTDCSLMEKRLPKQDMQHIAANYSNPLFEYLELEKKQQSQNQLPKPLSKVAVPEDVSTFGNSTRFLCHVCGFVTSTVWAIEAHKQLQHRGVQATHGEFKSASSIPPGFVRDFSKLASSAVPSPSYECTKCGVKYTRRTPFHAHILKCANKPVLLRANRRSPRNQTPE